MVRGMAVPGKTTIHHGGLKDSATTPPSILPQLGWGGGTPRPRKLNADSVKMAMPKWALTTTGKEAIHCGAIWCCIMRHTEAPSARTAST
jgi:hypothetical protein